MAEQSLGKQEENVGIANDPLNSDPRLSEKVSTPNLIPATQKPAAVAPAVPPKPSMTSLGVALGAKASVIAGGKPAATVAPRVAPVPKAPASLRLGFTGDLKEAAFLHALIYADTGMRKTSIACTFDDPEHTLVLITRRPEQLTPMRDLNYPYVEITDSASLEHGLLYPESLWEQMKAMGKRPMAELRTLVLDDATEAVDQLLEGAKDDLEDERQGRELKDRRQMYSRGKDDLRAMIKVVLRKPLNFVATAVAKVRENPLTNEETVGPDLPPSMLAMLGTEFEFVFYIRPSDMKFTTDRDRFTFVGKDDQTGKDKTFTRSILGKNKLPLAVAKLVPPVIAKYEEPDLRKLWTAVQKATVKGGAR